MQAPCGAHWNSHGKFDFRLGKVQLACARHARWLAALAAIDVQPTAALVPLAHGASVDVPLGCAGSGRGFLQAARSPRFQVLHSTPRVPDKPLLEALSCLRGIGVPSLPPPYRRIGAASIGPT